MLHTYQVTCYSTDFVYTVEAASSTHAKRIVCRMRGCNPNDYWTGISNYRAKKIA